MFWLYSFFFFKQKTAYELRISDWSSDVCSSDLCRILAHGRDENAIPERNLAQGVGTKKFWSCHGSFSNFNDGNGGDFAAPFRRTGFVDGLAEIGRASSRERVCRYV